MGKITLLLSTDVDKILRERAKKNLRSVSKEVEYILIDIFNRDKVK